MMDEVSPNGFAEGQGDADSDPFIRDLAAQLRVEEEVSPAFETRVMAAVRREAAAAAHRSTNRHWWWRRSIQLTPVGALALAASLAAVAYIGARAADGPGASASSAPQVGGQTADDRELVRFVFVDPNAHNVVVVGSFNQWRKDATPLAATGVPGVWAVSIPLEAGRHEYAFVVDGERWSPDPFAPAVTDEFGTESSIVRIGQAPTSS
jgi:hypothetical protein